MSPEDQAALHDVISESPRPVVDRIDRLISETRQTRYAINAFAMLMVLGFVIVIALILS